MTYSGNSIPQPPVHVYAIPVSLPGTPAIHAKHNNRFNDSIWPVEGVKWSCRTCCSAFLPWSRWIGAVQVHGRATVFVLQVERHQLKSELSKPDQAGSTATCLMTVASPLKTRYYRVLIEFL